MAQCPGCGGDGWTVDHSPDCYAAGACVGCGGVQVQCGTCGGSGNDPSAPKLGHDFGRTPMGHHQVLANVAPPDADPGDACGCGEC